MAALESLDEADEHLALDLETARRRRRRWTRDWVLRRPVHNTLYREIAEEDEGKFRQAFRMPPATFKKLLSYIAEDIKKKDTTMRSPINIETRLQICLRYLASGANFRTLEDIFRVPHNTISGIVSETAEAIWNRLRPIYLTCPSTEEEWSQISQDFYEQWNYPYCIGALDGKHCQVQNFANAGSLFHNYKNTFSLVLFGICDARYRFIYCNIGSAGSANDAAIWTQCSFKKFLDQGHLKIPETGGKVKHHLVGDDIFGLEETTMKPFPRRNLGGLLTNLYLD